MRKLTSSLLVACILFCAYPARATDGLASGTQTAATVSVQNVGMRSGVVSGLLLNNSPRLLRDVRLLVRFAWLWKNERAPRRDNPGRSDYYTVPGDIPAGGRLTFTYRPAPPLPGRSDGHFETAVEVAGFTEVGE